MIIFWLYSSSNTLKIKFLNKLSIFIFWFPGKQEVLQEKDEYIEGNWLLKLIGIYNPLFVLTLHFWLLSIFYDVPAKITKKLLG